MAKGQIHITIPENLLKKIDQAATEASMNRSEFMRHAAVEQLKFVDECRAKLANIAQNGMPEEEELFDLLRMKKLARAAAVWRREQRQSWSKKITQERGL